MDLDNILEQLNNNSLNYYQFYDIDLEIAEYLSIIHYINNPNDNIEILQQDLHIVFCDIELFLDHCTDINDLLSGNFIINAKTIFSTEEKIYHLYALLQSTISTPISEIESYYVKNLRSTKHITEDEDIKIHFFNNEIDLIKACWEKIHQLDPAILSGFNSDGFDYPYIYKRLQKLAINNNNINPDMILSKIGNIKSRNFKSVSLIEIPDYTIVDLRRLFIPRSEGGLNYGDSLNQYSLDSISKYVLNLQKVNYKNTFTNLDSFYENDPIGFFLYNIGDVALTVRLNEKLKFIDLHNILRRSMMCPLNMSLRGPSALYECYFSYDLMKNNTKVRFAINENINRIDKTFIDSCPKPKTKKIKWTLSKIDKSQYQAIINRYPGAYVKESPGMLFDDDNYIYIDLDAKSLYPSMQQQYNISFDSFFGRIIEPKIYGMIEKIDQFIKNKTIDRMFINNLSDIIVKYVKKLAPSNKNEYCQRLYYIIIHCLDKLIRYGKTSNELFNYCNHDDYLILKIYLITVLDLIAEILCEETNSVAYSLFVNNEIYQNDIYIIENEQSCTISIKKIKGSTIQSYLKEKNLCLTITGCLFYTHEFHSGLLNKFLKARIIKRDEYKIKRNSHPVDSKEYEFNDRRQWVFKINVNTAYGLTGTSSFRFSNKHLAKSTTISGKLCLKMAQACCEIYIDQLNSN